MIRGLMALMILSIVLVSVNAQAKPTGRYADQLYVEVSALNSLEYF